MDTWDDKTTGEKRSKIKVAGRPRPVPRPPRRATAAVVGPDDDFGASPPPREPAGRAAAEPPVAGRGRPGQEARAQAHGPGTPGRRPDPPAAGPPEEERRRYPVLNSPAPMLSGRTYARRG